MSERRRVRTFLSRQLLSIFDVKLANVHHSPPLPVPHCHSPILGNLPFTKTQPNIYITTLEANPSNCVCMCRERGRRNLADDDIIGGVVRRVFLEDLLRGCLAFRVAIRRVILLSLTPKPRHFSSVSSHLVSLFVRKSNLKRKSIGKRRRKVENPRNRKRCCLRPSERPDPCLGF